MNHRIWHFKRTNFDPLALVQKSCCGLLPSVLLFEGVVFFMSPRVCPAASMENSFVSRVWLARGSLLIVLYCSKAKMRYNDELIRQIQKDCLHWTRPSLCSSIFFPRKNTLSTPVLFIPKRFFSMELLMFGVKTRSCYFLSLWYFGKQEVKSYCSTYWICQGLSNIYLAK